MPVSQYQFKNKVCPICGNVVDAYNYTLDRDGVKIHTECKKDLLKVALEQERNNTIHLFNNCFGTKEEESV